MCFWKLSLMCANINHFGLNEKKKWYQVLHWLYTGVYHRKSCTLELLARVTWGLAWLGFIGLPSAPAVPPLNLIEININVHKVLFTKCNSCFYKKPTTFCWITLQSVLLTESINRCTTPFSFHAFSAQLLKAKPFKKSNEK